MAFLYALFAKSQPIIARPDMLCQTVPSTKFQDFRPPNSYVHIVNQRKSFFSERRRRAACHFTERENESTKEKGS